MRFKHLHAVLAFAIGCTFMGCRSEVDFNNIDSTAQLGLGMAIPVGSLNLTVSDLIGSNIPGLYVDTLKNKGVLTFRMDTTISRYYHQVDLKEHISEKTVDLEVYKKLNENSALAAMLTTNGKVTGTGEPITLDFPLTLKLNGINQSFDDLGERIDSALIDMASFSSQIDTSHLPLQWEWIDQVTLDLGPQVTRPAGNTMVVYDKNRDTDKTKFNYGLKVPTDVDKFRIILMKNRKPNGWSQHQFNVVDTCQFTIHFTFTIPAGQEVEVSPDAKFVYNLGVQFVDYSAIWGMFRPSKDMRSEQVIDLGNNWGDLEYITRMHMPFSDPVVNVNIGTQVAGALLIDSAYIFTEDHNRQRTSADFGDGKDFRRVVFQEGEYLSLNSQIGDSTTKMNVTFDNTVQGGQIHRMFRNIPSKLGYKFAVSFDEQQTPQIRIPENTAIKIKVNATLPLMFNEGLHIDFADTARDVNLSAFTMDSLLAQVKEIDSLHINELRIIMNAENDIPLCMKVYMRCLDERNQIIMDPVDATQPLLLFEQDTVRLVAPTYANNGGWHKAAPGKTQLLGYLTQEKIDLLPQIRKIVYYVVIDDESLKEAYKQGLVSVAIKNTDKLRLTIGLAADVDARLNFNNQNTK